MCSTIPNCQQKQRILCHVVQTNSGVRLAFRPLVTGALSPGLKRLRRDADYSLFVLRLRGVVPPRHMSSECGVCTSTGHLHMILHSACRLHHSGSSNTKKPATVIKTAATFIIKRPRHRKRE